MAIDVSAGGTSDTFPSTPLDPRRSPATPRDSNLGRFSWRIICLIVPMLLVSSTAHSFRLIGQPDRWVRWDAAPRYIGGEDRSLHNGLRYSIETGSYAALRDQFLWVPFPPSEADFAAAIARAFENWEVVDPETGLAAGFYFVEDLGTPAIDDPGNPQSPGGQISLNAGAEIDIFASTPHAGPAFAASVRFFVDTTADDLTLTTGATNYPGFAISGADIRINPAFVWSLTGFQLLLTHRIGHALGLADLEAPTTPGTTSAFLDNNFDPTSGSSALSTLSDSFALTIYEFDPDVTPLQEFAPDITGDPGLDTPGALLLMESNGIFDLLGVDPYLQNDEFAARQFLYPVAVPEPDRIGSTSIGIFTLVVLSIISGRTRRETR